METETATLKEISLQLNNISITTLKIRIHPNWIFCSKLFKVSNHLSNWVRILELDRGMVVIIIGKHSNHCKMRAIRSWCKLNSKRISNNILLKLSNIRWVNNLWIPRTELVNLCLIWYNKMRIRTQWTVKMKIKEPIEVSNHLSNLSMRLKKIYSWLNISKSWPILMIFQSLKSKLWLATKLLRSSMGQMQEFVNRNL